MNRITTLLVVLIVACLLSSWAAYRAGYARGRQIQASFVRPPDHIESQEPSAPRRESPAAESEIPKITSKEIETFGNDMLGKQVQMICRFGELDNTWVRLFLGPINSDRDVGFSVYDQKGDLFQYAFADKAKYGRALLNLKQGQEIRIVGGILKVEDRYFLLASEISW
jgi:hypothetical protein